MTNRTKQLRLRVDKTSKLFTLKPDRRAQFLDNLMTDKVEGIDVDGYLSTKGDIATICAELSSRIQIVALTPQLAAAVIKLASTLVSSAQLATEKKAALEAKAAEQEAK